MRKPVTSVVPLLLCAGMSILLRLIPQTRLWSPLIWESERVFGVNGLVATGVLVIIAVWAAGRGSETIKRTAAVALPVALMVLVATEIAGFTTGISARFMPLASTTGITMDFLLFSGTAAWIFDILKKVEKK